MTVASQRRTPQTRSRATSAGVLRRWIASTQGLRTRGMFCVTGDEADGGATARCVSTPVAHGWHRADPLQGGLSMMYEELVAEVQRRGGLETTEEAERALSVTARALGERLLPDEARPLAASLPPPVADRILAAEHAHDFDVEELYERVARGEGSGRRFGAEHAQVVCQILGESVPESVRQRLQRHLGPQFAPLFDPRTPTSRPPRPLRISPPVESGRGTTLATGRPGSRHPLSVSDGDRAQSQSVARSTDPHGETKLSSSRGLTQERLDDTLAVGRPGPASPVSDTKR